MATTEQVQDFRHPSGPAFVHKLNGTERLRLSPSGLIVSAPIAAPRFNGMDGMKSFGPLGAGAATATIAVNAGSGTVFNIPASSTVGNLFALQPSAVHGDMLLMQNRSAATQAVYNLGVGVATGGSGLVARINPSGAAWFRFASGAWELHGRYQMGMGF